MEKRYNKRIFVVESKADSTYKIVSGASIIAKVQRDFLLKEIENEYNCINKSNISLGSGYPADPFTIKFLNNNYDHFIAYPSFVRFKWKTLEKYLPKRKSKKLKGELTGFYLKKDWFDKCK